MNGGLTISRRRALARVDFKATGTDADVAGARGERRNRGTGDAVEREITVTFSDIRAFTTLSEKMTPEENFNFLNSYLSRVGPVIRQHGGFIDKYIGDAVMALFDEDETLGARRAVGPGGARRDHTLRPSDHHGA